MIEEKTHYLLYYIYYTLLFFCQSPARHGFHHTGIPQNKLSREKSTHNRQHMGTLDLKVEQNPENFSNKTKSFLILQQH